MRGKRSDRRLWWCLDTILPDIPRESSPCKASLTRLREKPDLFFVFQVSAIAESYCAVLYNIAFERLPFDFLVKIFESVSRNESKWVKLSHFESVWVDDNSLSKSKTSKDMKNSSWNYTWLRYCYSRIECSVFPSIRTMRVGRNTAFVQGYQV